MRLPLLGLFTIRSSFFLASNVPKPGMAMLSSSLNRSRTHSVIPSTSAAASLSLRPMRSATAFISSLVSIMLCFSHLLDAKIVNPQRIRKNYNYALFRRNRTQHKRTSSTDALAVGSATAPRLLMVGCVRLSPHSRLRRQCGVMQVVTAPRLILLDINAFALYGRSLEDGAFGSHTD